ncbi:MAG: putative metal-binding motif-containing protein, partial [Myxococcota bacterium]|nr:putative metal-binding motif-containing protein [Myxococcota bacterium]
GLGTDCEVGLGACTAPGFKVCAADEVTLTCSVNPVTGGNELCNEQDDDCDGLLGADELDDDGDNWLVCEGDCDDGDFTVHPNMVEQCADNVDNECDGLVDLDDPDCTGWIDPALACGPVPDLSAGTPPFAVITGSSDTEVSGAYADGWHWMGCQAMYEVAQLGMLDCGILWEVEGWSTAVDPAASTYVMGLDLYVINDTCGNGNDVYVEYRIQDVSGNWTVYEVSVYDPFSYSWVVMDPDAPGELHWAPNGTEGWGWIEYASGAWP